MENSIFIQTAKFLRERRDNRRWRIVVICLALIVVCGTAWVLSKKGQALTRAEDVLDCQLTVHEHDEGCYDEDGNLICGKADYVFHEHDDACYDAEGKLVCLLPEIKEHVHTSDCFETEEILICQDEEDAAMDEQLPDEEDKGYSDTGDKAKEPELVCGQEEHTHDDRCYEYESEKITYEETVEVLTCSQSEHQHEEGCRNEEGELICGQEEHTHNDGCYEYETVSHEQEGETQEVLICGQEEHQHSDACYNEVSEEPDTPAETVSDKDTGYTHEHDESCYRTVRKLICDEKAAHTHDDSCYDLNGNLVCGAPFVESVETHMHDKECFRSADETDDGTKYTKTFSNDDLIVTAVYGKTANIPEEAQMRAELTTEETDSDYYEQRLKELEETEGILEEEETLAALLQILFYTDDEIVIPEDTIRITVQFLNDNIYGEDDAIKAVRFTGDGVETLDGVKGDSDNSVTFELDEFTELAFIAQKEEEDEESRALTYEGENYIVTVIPGEDTEIPEGAELSVEEITEENDQESYEQCLEELKEAELLSDEEAIAMLLRFGIFADGEEILPKETMDVTVQFLNHEIYFEGDPVKAAYFTEGGVEQLPAADIDDQISTTFTVNELGKLVFITDANIRTMTYEGEDFIVTVRFGKDAMIPENAELLAERITQESDPEHFAEMEKQLQDEITDDLIALSVLMDISFYDMEGLEIEPQDTVDVKIQLLDRSSIEKDDSPRVVHFVEEGVEIFEDADIVEDEGNSLSTTFQVDSFSLYGFMVDGVVKNAYTFRKAMRLVKDGGTIKLMADFDFQSDREPEDEIKESEEDEEIENGSIKLNKKVTLDLNGHCIRVIGNVTLIDIGAGGELILIDSEADYNSKEELAGYDAVVSGYTKSDPDIVGELVYSATESELVDGGLGITKEVQRTYKVRGGAIVGSTENKSALFYMEDGKLTIEKGIIYGNYGRAVNIAEYGGTGELELKEAYLVGCQNDWLGGAVYSAGGKITIDRGTVISGNKGFRGGGICAFNSMVTMNDGGYITDNTATWNANEWYGNGGGILLIKSHMTMTGGYITGNTSYMGGGGIAADAFDWNQRRDENKSELKLEGGYISGNFVAGSRGEGGGVGIYDCSEATIGNRSGSSTNKLYITNNRVSQTADWGGGGLFVGEEAKAYLFYTLITENSADGFGGGLAGCSTGRIIEDGKNSQMGVAIFDNYANGTAYAGGSSAKADQDKKYVGEKDDGVNPAFWQLDANGRYLFQDHFSVLYSYLENSMLGGGLARWDGSIDGERIDTTANSWTSSYVIGLTANPDTDAKGAAKNAAKVYITGNFSSVHGGGIMCNGIMIIGDTSGAIEINSALELEAKKVLTDAEEKEFFDIEAGQFSFTVYKNEACTKPVITGTNGASESIGTGDAGKVANITFDQLLTFDLRRDLNREDIEANPLKENTYTYYIKEDISGDPRNSGIKFDESIYRLKVTVKQKFKENFNGVNKYVDDITEVLLERKDGSGNWAKVNTYYPESNEKHAVKVCLTDSDRNDGAIFRNVQSNVTNIRVRKVWDDGIDLEKANVDSVHVALYQVEKGDTDADSGEQGKRTKYKEADLKSGSWEYEWKDLPEDYDYEVVEEYVVYKDDELHYQPEDKFDVQYKYSTEDKTAIVTITNAPKTYNLELKKVGENKTDEGLFGAKFELLNKDGFKLQFKQHTGNFVYYDGTDPKGVSETIVTDADGRISIVGLPAGTYTLRETQAPSGYKTMWDHTFTLGDDKGLDLSCDEKGEKTCTEVEIVDSGQGNSVFKLKLTDKEDKYELPETGGFGTLYLNILGAILMCGIVALIYKTYRRRKEGVRR